MLLPLLCTLILSTQLGLSLVVKSLFMLLLGPGNHSSEVLSNITTVHTSNSSDSSTRQFILGTYNLESSSNFDSYLEEMGVSYFLRQLAQLAQPSVTFDINCQGENRTQISDTDQGDDEDDSNGNENISLSSPQCVWSIHTDAGIKIHDIVFTIGEEVKDTTMDGREVTSKFLLSRPNTLIEEQMGESVNTTLTRNFYEDSMDVIMEVNGVIAQSVFKRKTS
eukprot:GFUD01027595.1.p1 GENE.GFUD01027595.1~~GFUD01027595.1.p1  ORF type:complete len:222 (+),score=53.59 GFUD01027595.1:346-1011(+)